MPPSDSVSPSATLDLLDALTFSERRFSGWFQQRHIESKQFDAVVERYKALRDRIDRAGPSNGVSLTGLPAAMPGESNAAHSLRYWMFVNAELHRFTERNVLSLAQSHGLSDEVRERIQALTRKLRPDEIPDVIPVAELAEGDDFTPAKPPPPPLPSAATPRRNLLEILLDPRNIQYLLAFGGAMMVVGVIILLWVNQVFTPPVVAAALAAGNLAILGLGWYLIRATRYQTAGRALTLLACLVMPLNLWYLNTNHETIGAWTRLDHGQLWVAGLAIAALYFASALVLRDELFVYVSCAGVAMTGLLFIASLDPSPQRFWEIARPTALLVVLGLIAIHLERAFPEQEGPFGRKRFGLAFFFSGHVQLAAGLLLLLGAFVYGDWLSAPVTRAFAANGWAYVAPTVVDRAQHLWLAIALVAAGTYAYIYSDLIVRHLGVYIHVAAFTLFWLMVLVIEQLDLKLGIDALIGILAATALLINLLQASVLRGSKYTKAFPLLGVVLPLAAVSIGVVVYFRHMNPDLRSIWKGEQVSWGYLAAMALTAVSCRLGAWVHRDQTALSAVYHFATAAATLAGAGALLASLGLETWQEHGPILMLLPIAYAIAAHLYRGSSTEKPLVWVAHVATLVMLAASVASALEGFIVQEGKPLNLMLALFFGEVALFYALCAGLHRQTLGIHLCAAAACGAVWQVFHYLGAAGELYTLVFAVVGLGILVAYRVASGRMNSARANALFQAGNALLSLSFVAAALLGLSRLTGPRETPWTFISLSGGLTVLSLAAVVLVRERTWRRWYVVTTIGLAALTFLAVTLLSDLAPVQKVEVFCVAVGLLLLIVAHIGWYREQERENDLVSVGLFLGSLMVGLPLAIATIVDRTVGQMYWWNELGWLAAAVLLFMTGFLFRLRATTIIGGLLLALYLVTLLIKLPWSRMNTVALTLTIGGGGIFLLGLILSVFREHLLTMPERIRGRQGVFRVLNWR